VSTTLDDQQILADLAAILDEVAGVASDDVSPEKSFVDDLDVDSLSMVEVAMAVEEKFHAKIPDDKLSELKTVGDAVTYIKEHSAA
jgi:acyl carrier protein